MIKFESIKEVTDFVSFDGSLMKQEIEHRKDPLTGVVATINGYLGEKAKAFLGSKDTELLREMEEKTRANCPFCVANKTGTRFSESFTEGGFLREGDSICVPNLFSKAKLDAVCIINIDKHLLNMKEYSNKDFYNALINCKRFIEKGKTYYNLPYHVLGMNFLHPGGSSVPHPHLQVHLRGFEYSGITKLIDLSKEFFIKTGENYWQQLLLKEKELGLRYISDMGQVQWIVPFAPSHQKEIWGLVNGKSSITELTEKEIHAISEGISRALAFYEDEGNTFTFALLSSPDDHVNRYFSLQIRLCARPAFKSLFSNYDTWFNPMFVGEDVHTQSPEEYGLRLKTYFI